MLTRSWCCASRRLVQRSWLAWRFAATYRRYMPRMLAVIVAVILIVLVAAAVVKTFFWLALIALIVGALGLGLGFFRLGRYSARRPRGRF